MRGRPITSNLRFREMLGLTEVASGHICCEAGVDRVPQGYSKKAFIFWSVQHATNVVWG